MDLIDIARQLAGSVDALTFSPPVRHVYNPLDYAWAAHRSYLERYGRGARQVVLVGMNPGPWGMAQNGVPFGEVSAVRDWLKIRAPIGRPPDEHPKRPVEGLACRRSEVSGRRLWGWARRRFATPQRFFRRFFVLNYCPLLFLEAGGRNRTPDRLPVAERQALEDACDQALRRSVEVLRPRHVVGVGRYAERAARRALGEGGPQVGSMPHPSPASPAANRGWEALAERALEEMGIRL